jgi:hypothetical protein
MPGPSCRAPVADASWQSQLGSSCGSARATTSGLLLQCNDGAQRWSCSRKVVHEGLCSPPWPPREACLPCRVYGGRLGGCSTRAEQPLLVHAHKARTDQQRPRVSWRMLKMLQPPIMTKPSRLGSLLCSSSRTSTEHRTCSGMHQEGRLGMMGRACAHVAGLKRHKHVGQSCIRSTGLMIQGDPVQLRHEHTPLFSVQPVCLPVQPEVGVA